ncbi:META and DUF4377 domain-containing protein [Acinetobacter sp. HR7]|uniref:META and DUF4377 domain-containing protein n=2 Tax=Acinetobacter TaxID=469 RepID=UPI000537F4E7|nr:META and DUF4377 domain-containing protein [Acinetobacter sp. HR7]KGT47337.1 hypothetical protein GW12_16960 [Acinetobacter sp. HR7]
MKLKYLFALVLPFSLAACQSNDVQKVGDLAVSVLQQQNAAKTLTAYEWHLDTGATDHLVLSFHKDNRFSVKTMCNSLGGSWNINADKLETGTVISTMKACTPEAMQQEKLAGEIFDNHQLPFNLNATDTEAPTLTITANNQQYVLHGKMTPETKYNGEAEIVFLEIAPETKPCTGVAPQICLQVREVKYNEQGLKTLVDQDWTLFYDQIEGFSHSPNERQIIRVKRFEIKHPVADQSKYAYIFDLAVEREAVKGSL